MNNHINLLVTIDCKYIQPTIIMLHSYEKCHPGIETDVYILHSSLSEKNISEIESSLNSDFIKIHSIKITDKRFSQIPVIDRLPEESFYRLLAFYYLPSEVRKCIYLDPDIYIKKSLTELYNMDLNNCYIAAASHLDGMINQINLFRLGLEKQKKYINSGVMLMDIDLIRKDFSVEKILEYTRHNTHRLLMGDQDLINMLFDGRIMIIDECIYNLDEKTINKKRNIITDEYINNNTAIIHYNGKYKPWLSGYKGRLDSYYPDIVEKGPAPEKRWRQQAKAITSIIFSQVGFINIVRLLRFLIIAIFFIKILSDDKIQRIVLYPETIQLWIERFGAWDEIVFIAIRSFQTMFKLIPAEPMEIASGFLWGTAKGTLCCLTGNFIGTLMILFLTEKFGHSFVNRFVSTKNHGLYSLFKNKKNLYKNLFIIYLLPGLPKDAMVYISGLMSVKKLPFTVITTIARIPFLALSVSCGTLAANKQYGLSAFLLVSVLLITVITVILWYKKSIKRA